MVVTEFVVSIVVVKQPPTGGVVDESRQENLVQSTDVCGNLLRTQSVA